MTATKEKPDPSASSEPRSGADPDGLDDLWSALTPDPQGLVTAVVQDADHGRLLMVGMISREALARTLERRRITFWSRSRRCLWEKGETSGNTLDLVELWVDCDGDALLVRARPRGPTCHTGHTSCFFRQVEEDRTETRKKIIIGKGKGKEKGAPVVVAADILDRLSAVIAARRDAATGESYVRSLLDRGIPASAAKIEEEGGELIEALAATPADPNQIPAEAADLLFHAMVGLAHHGLDLHAVRQVLAERFGVSGIDEKASRRPRTE